MRNMQHASTSSIPRGSVATDRNGDYLVVWPDGRYGYDADHVHRVPSGSTGPYEVVLRGLDDADCDALAGVPLERRYARLEALCAVAALMVDDGRVDGDGAEVRPGSVAQLIKVKTAEVAHAAAALQREWLARVTAPPTAQN